jgi:hypothetical protein
MLVVFLHFPNILGSDDSSVISNMAMFVLVGFPKLNPSSGHIFFLFKISRTGCRWFMPIILATQEDPGLKTAQANSS